MDLDKLRHQLAMSLSREIEFDVTDIFGPKNKGRFVNSLICKVFILRRKIHLFLIVSFSLVGKVVQTIHHLIQISHIEFSCRYLSFYALINVNSTSMSFYDQFYQKFDFLMIPACPPKRVLLLKSLVNLIYDFIERIFDNNIFFLIRFDFLARFVPLKIKLRSSSLDAQRW